MLDSFQIEIELIRRGFSLEVDSAHAKGYVKTLWLHPVFVKQRSVDGKRVAVSKAPLVIHPDLGEMAAAAAASSSGLHVEPKPYANSNLRGFPRSRNHGEQEIAKGTALSIADSEALDHLISYLTPRELWDMTPEQGVALQELNDAPGFKELPSTTRYALVQARVGQGMYRQRLMSLWSGRCSVTGVGIEAVLIASHVKPWQHASNDERLDHYNGLLLAASVDRLFDKGMISFDDDGHMLFKEGLPIDHLHLLGLSPQSRLRDLPDRLRPYLAYHRCLHDFVSHV